MFYTCTALVAQKLNLHWVNYWAIAPVEPCFTTLWFGSNRALYVPNPLSYKPQTWMRVTTQHMVGSHDARLSHICNMAQKATARSISGLFLS